MLRPMTDTNPPSQAEILAVCQAYSPFDDYMHQLDAKQRDNVLSYWWDSLLIGLSRWHGMVVGDTVCERLLQRYLEQQVSPTQTYCGLIGCDFVPVMLRYWLRRIEDSSGYPVDPRIQKDAPEPPQSQAALDCKNGVVQERNTYLKRQQLRRQLANDLFTAATTGKRGTAWVTCSTRINSQGDHVMDMYLRLNAEALPAESASLLAGLPSEFRHLVVVNQDQDAFSQYALAVQAAVEALVMQQLKTRYTDYAIRLGALAVVDSAP